MLKGLIWCKKKESGIRGHDILAREAAIVLGRCLNLSDFLELFIII